MFVLSFNYGVLCFPYMFRKSGILLVSTLDEMTGRHADAGISGKIRRLHRPVVCQCGPHLFGSFVLTLLLDAGHHHHCRSRSPRQPHLENACCHQTTCQRVEVCSPPFVLVPASSALDFSPIVVPLRPPRPSPPDTRQPPLVPLHLSSPAPAALRRVRQLTDVLFSQCPEMCASAQSRSLRWSSSAREEHSLSGR